ARALSRPSVTSRGPERVSRRNCHGPMVAPTHRVPLLEPAERRRSAAATREDWATHDRARPVCCDVTERPALDSAHVVRRTAAVAVLMALAGLGLARLAAVQPAPRLALQWEDYAALPITADSTNQNPRAQLARVNFL